ncbi:MAG: universal stress protein, partial [Frankiaceae bacterium]
MSSRSHGGEVVVGTDGSPHGDAAVDWAAAEAYRRGARLHVVHAWRASPPPIPPLAP